MTTSNNEINNQLLIEACRSGDLDTAKLLLKHHVADPNAVSSNNKTPCLLLACATNCAPLVRALIDAGADITKKMETTEVSALHAAAATGSVDVLDVLLDRLTIENKNSSNLLVQESVINCETLRDGLTPLHFACKGSNSKKSGQVVKKLLEAGADCFKLSSSNLSVFHICAQSKNVEAAKAIVLHFLCDSTSSTNEKSDYEDEGKRKLQTLLVMKHETNDKTPEEIAREKNDEEMLRLFQLLNKDEDLSVDEILAEHSSSPSPPPPPSSPPEDATFAGEQVKRKGENEEENKNDDNEENEDDDNQEQARSLFDPFERLPSITMSMVSNLSEKKNRKLSNVDDNDENAKKNDGSTLNSIDLFGASSNNSVGNDQQQSLRIDLLSPEPSSHNDRRPPKRSPLLMKLFGKKPEDDQDQHQQIQHQKEEIKISDENEKKEHEQEKKHFSSSCSSIATSDVSFTLDDVKVDGRNEEVIQKSGQQNEAQVQEKEQEKVVLENDKPTGCHQEQDDPHQDDEEVHAAETTSSSRVFIPPSESNKMVVQKKEVSMDELFAPAVASDDNEKQQEEQSAKNEYTNPNPERNTSRREISDDLFPLSASSPQNAASVVASNRVGDVNNNDKLLDSLFSPTTEDVKNEKNRVRDHHKSENQIEPTANNTSLLLDEYLREQDDRRNHRTSITNENENENKSSDTSNEDDPQPSESIPEPTPRTLGGGPLEIPIISPLPFSSSIRTHHHHQNYNYNNNHHHHHPHSYLGEIRRRPPPPAAAATTPTMSSPMASSNVVHENNYHRQPQNFTSPRHTVLLARMPKWLALLDLPNELKIILMEQKIDEEDFYELTDEDLKSIGMEIGYRKKIMRIVNSVIC